MRFKKPKYGAFNYYCYECTYWKYERSVGCANIGYCHAIKDEVDEKDAYNPSCGLFKRKEQK